MVSSCRAWEILFNTLKIFHGWDVNGWGPEEQVTCADNCGSCDSSRISLWAVFFSCAEIWYLIYDCLFQIVATTAEWMFHGKPFEMLSIPFKFVQLRFDFFCATHGSWSYSIWLLPYLSISTPHLLTWADTNSIWLQQWRWCDIDIGVDIDIHICVVLVLHGTWSETRTYFQFKIKSPWSRKWLFLDHYQSRSHSHSHDHSHHVLDLLFVAVAKIGSLTHMILYILFALGKLPA